MLFNSYHYLIFFPLVVVIYYILPHKTRWLFILIASYYFYSCLKIEYLLILAFSTLADYFIGLKMSKIAEKKHRKKWLYLSIFINLGLLCSFKYLNLINETIRATLNCFNIFYNIPNFNLLLPIGISFYTFQALSYTIDIYRDEIKAEKHLGIFAAYISFFPQLLAGPIERAGKLIPQHYRHNSFNIQRITHGIKIMIWGFFKKIVIADNIAIYVSKIYDSPADYYGATVIVAVILFAFQVYCDFSGYTDIAIGSAKILGFDLTNNFQRPFFSKSMTEFWGRWHITLSRWFRDYVFIPFYNYNNKLFRKITLKVRHNIAYSVSLSITLILLGLWHGAAFKFIIMGAIFGFIVVYEQLTKKYRTWFFQFTHLNKHIFIKTFFQIIFTFSLFSLTTVFFRAKSTVDAITIINNIFIFPEQNIVLHFTKVLNQTWSLFLLVIFLLFIDFVERKKSLIEYFDKKPAYFEWVFYTIIILLMINYSNFTEVSFIYFLF